MFIFEDHNKLVYIFSDLLFRSDHATYTLSREALSTSVGYREAWSLKLFHLAGFLHFEKRVRCRALASSCGTCRVPTTEG